jgi:hypothetical protein
MKRPEKAFWHCGKLVTRFMQVFKFSDLSIQFPSIHAWKHAENVHP